MEVIFIFLTTTPSLYLNIIYERLILAAVYRINFPVTIFNFYPILAPHLVSTTYEGKAIANTL